MYGSDGSRPTDYKRAVVIDTGPKKPDNRKHSLECMEKFVLKKI
jgi:hypothetical protein